MASFRRYRNGEEPRPGNLRRNVAGAALLCGIAAAAVGAPAPQAGAEEAIRWGGEWKGAGEATFYETKTEAGASASLRLYAQTATYPWRLFLDGRLGVDQSLTGDVEWDRTGGLDRLYLRFYLPSADLSVGKQAINWGVGYAWDPTDVFNPPDPTDPEGVRPGIVSAVARIPVGPLSYWSVAAADGREGNKFGIRRRGNYEGTDWSVLAARDGGGTVIGADAKGDWGVGWHAAAAYRMPDEGADRRPSDGLRSSPTEGLEPSWRGLIGADYSWLLGGLVWTGEYVAGSDNEPERNMTFQQLTYRVDEFTSVFGSVLADLSEGSEMWNAGVTTFLGRQSQLTVGVRTWTGQADWPAGPRPEAVVTAEISRAF